MARNSNENKDDNIDPASVASNVKNTFKQDVIKELLNSSFEDNKTKLGNDALSLVVEVAKCLVTETCLRASSQALRESCDKVDIEHVEKCLPQLMLDFP
ncbi:centromere protein X-like [Cydia fagiglandana]|uniref:centromere protein X-like n=1 Tax=Cydia fagiglandana TaxID=1458189 RepID=UPI0021327C30